VTLQLGKNIRKIRVLMVEKWRFGGIKFLDSNNQVVSEVNRYKNDKSQWKEFCLDKSECIVGVYGVT